MKPLIVAALLAMTFTTAEAQRPVQTQRSDRNGVTWLYGERTDPMDDRRQVGLTATWRRSGIGLGCVQGSGLLMRIRIDGWHFVPRVAETIRARVDQAPAFDIEFTGINSAWAEAEANRAGRELAQGLLTGRERIILRNEDGETFTLNLSVPRPEAERFRQRCGEIAPATTSDEGATARPRVGAAPAGTPATVAAEAIRTHGPDACPRVTGAERGGDGSIRARCSNGETFRVFTVEDQVVAMRCSAARDLGVAGC